MSAEQPNHQDIITWDASLKQSNEKPWEVLSVGEMSLPQLAQLLESSPKTGRSKEVLSRVLSIVNAGTDVNQSNNFNIEDIRKKLIDKATGKVQKILDTEINDNEEYQQSLKRGMFDAEFANISYIVESESIGKSIERFGVLLDLYNSGNISFQEYSIKVLQEKTKILLKFEDIGRQADITKLYRNQPKLRIEDIEDVLGVKLDIQTVGIIIDSGIQFIANNGDGAYIFWEGVYVGDIQKNGESLAEHICEIACKYKEIPLSSILSTPLGIGNEIQDSSRAKSITVPELLQENILHASNQGIEFKVEKFLNPRNYTIGMYTGDRKIGESRIGHSNYGLDILLLNQHIDLATTESKKDKKEVPDYDTITYLNETDFPKGMDIEKRKVEIINAFFKFYDLSKGKFIGYERLLSVLNHLPEELEIPNPQKNQIILSYYKKILERFPGFAKQIIENPNTFFIPSEIAIGYYNLIEEDFGDTVNSQTGYTQELFISCIKTNPEIALQNIDSLVNIFLRELGRSPGTNQQISSIEGKLSLRYSILKIIFSSYPQLSQKYGKLFNEFTGFKKLVDTSSSYSDILSGGYNQDLSTFSNADQFPGIFDILPNIPDSIFGGLDLIPKMKAEYKVAIARNISARFNYDGHKIIINFEQNKNRLIEEEWALILENKSKITDNPMFANRDTFHIAHFGQGVDGFGTPATQKAFTEQSQSYTLFDAEDLLGKTKKIQNHTLNEYVGDFINNPNPSTLVLEGHASENSFSVLLEYSEKSELELAYTDLNTIGITPDELAEIIIQRNKIRLKSGNTSPDLIIFSACKGDYARRVYQEALNIVGIEWSIDFQPPILITAAEFGENSLFNPNQEIPYQIFREVLGMGKNDTETITFGTFFENQHIEGNNSNPSIFYPVLQEGKWIPKNLG